MAHGDDRGLRLPPRLAPDPGGRHGRARRRRRDRPVPRRWPTSCARPASGCSSTTRSRSRPAAGPPTGSSRACRCGSSSAPATWPRRSVTLVDRITGDEGRRSPLAGVGRGRGRRRSTRPSRPCSTEALGPPRRRAPSTSPPSTRPVRPARPAAPACPWSRGRRRRRGAAGHVGGHGPLPGPPRRHPAPVRRRARPDRRHRPLLLTRSRHHPEPGDAHLCVDPIGAQIGHRFE